MFGSRKVVVYQRPSAAEVFGTLLTIFIIGALIAVFAIYVSIYILVAFLGVGVLIGLVYSLIVYIRAFIDSVRNLGSYSPRSSGAVMAVIEKLFALETMTAVEAFHANLSNASGALTRAQSYRLISFRKWMWLIAALAMVVFGVLLIVAFIFLQFGLLLGACGALVGIVVLLCVLFFAASFFYAIFFETEYLAGSCRDELDFTGYTFTKYVTFHDVGYCLGTVFASFGRQLGALWRLTVERARDNFTDGRSRPLYSLYRWLLIVSPAALCIWAGVYTVLCCIFLPILFLLMWLAFLLFTCVVKIFVH